MRRKKAAAHENHERWLVSYADFITLLFAFFVVMFASAQADKSKAKEVSESVKEALRNGRASAMISSLIIKTKKGSPPPPAPESKGPAPPRPETPADLKKSADELKKGLELELKQGKVQIKVEGRGLVISLREAAFFDSGDDRVAAASFPILAKIAVVIQKLPNHVRLEGHTDSKPIHTPRFRNNWDLSAARSVAMLELLRDQYQFNPLKMSIAGYGENAPVDTNETEEGRAHNRRVDLVVLSAEGMNGEPPPNPSTTAAAYANAMYGTPAKSAPAPNSSPPAKH